MNAAYYYAEYLHKLLKELRDSGEDVNFWQVLYTHTSHHILPSQCRSVMYRRSGSRKACLDHVYSN